MANILNNHHRQTFLSNEQSIGIQQNYSSLSFIKKKWISSKKIVLNILLICVLFNYSTSFLIKLIHSLPGSYLDPDLGRDIVSLVIVYNMSSITSIFYC